MNNKLKIGNLYKVDDKNHLIKIDKWEKPKKENNIIVNEILLYGGLIYLYLNNLNDNSSSDIWFYLNDVKLSNKLFSQPDTYEEYLTELETLKEWDHLIN